MPGAYVIDASVAIKLFVDEEHSDLARELLQGLAADEPDEFYAPSLLYPECANVLWKYVHRYGYDSHVARSNLDDLLDLAFRIVTTDDLTASAFDLALTYGITIYDACYVALAQATDFPLVTADKKLLLSMPGSGASARFLGDFPF